MDWIAFRLYLFASPVFALFLACVGLDLPVCDQTPRCVLVALFWVARCRVLWLVFCFHGPRLLVDAPVCNRHPGAFWLP
jgi:hypothetical protein